MAVETMDVCSCLTDVAKEDGKKLLYDAIPKSTTVPRGCWIHVFDNFCKSQKIV